MIKGELFAEAHKVVDSYIETIEKHILNRSEYIDILITGTQLTLND